MSDLENAIARGDEKLQPGEVPITAFTGIVKAPQTDGKVLLVFNDTKSDTAYGVRLEDHQLEELYYNIEGMLE